MALRICRVCGRKAHTEEDLENFKKCSSSPYGRDTICTPCNNKHTREHHRAHRKEQREYRRKALNFKGKTVYPPKNTRTNICVSCSKRYPEELKRQTHLHHVFYDEDNPLAGTIELCHSCHAKLHGLGTKIRPRKKLANTHTP